MDEKRASERRERRPLYIVTGATGSMGRVAVRRLAEQGKAVVMACRDLVEGAALRAELLRDLPEADLRLEHLELTSEQSVRHFAQAMSGQRIAGLFNNAGTMTRHHSPVGAEGWEEVMVVNYLMPALLTRLLVPLYEPGARIVNMGSLAIHIGRAGLDWPQWGQRHFQQIRSYADSKRAFLLFTIAMARRYPHLRVNMADPGIVDSDMIRLSRWFDPLTDLLFRPFIFRPERGVQPALAALETEQTMRYFVGRECRSIPRRHLGDPLVDLLWQQTTTLFALEG